MSRRKTGFRQPPASYFNLISMFHIFQESKITRAVQAEPMQCPSSAPLLSELGWGMDAHKGCMPMGRGSQSPAGPGLFSVSLESLGRASSPGFFIWLCYLVVSRLRKPWLNSSRPYSAKLMFKPPNELNLSMCKELRACLSEVLKWSLSSPKLPTK